MTDIERRIEENSGLAWQWLHRYKLAYSHEAQSIAFEALWRACAAYDEESGVRFSTFAVTCIQRSLWAHLTSITRKSNVAEHAVSLDRAKYDDSEVTALDDVDAGIDLESDTIQKESIRYIWQALKEEAEKYTGKKRQMIDIWLNSNLEASFIDIGLAVGVSTSYVNQSMAEYKNNVKGAIRRWRQTY